MLLTHFLSLQLGEVVPDFCRDFTFKTPVSGRRLQASGGANCSFNVLDVARNNTNFSIFSDLIEVAGLDKIFSCSGPFTAMVPTNDAFSALDP